MTPGKGELPLSDSATVWFAGKLSSIAAARRYAAGQLEEWGFVVEPYVAALLVSELTSNAVRHARSGFQLDLRHAPGSVRIAVSDDSPSPPVLHDLEPSSSSGYGLHIVERLASDWGFELRGEGKWVWADLPGS